MNTTEYIESGNLELYVYGLLNESETMEISALAKTDGAIQNEIISIEKAIVNLSSSFSPLISADNFEKIKAKLELKHGKVIEMKPKSNTSQYLSWAASIALLIGVGYQYNKLNDSNSKINSVEQEKSSLQKSVVDLELKNKQTATALNVVRDSKNTVVNLAGQTVDPTASAKIYWNKDTQTVYVDASGLPEPPAGKVYQIWSLKLSPTLTPTSIGLLDNFTGNNERLFAVSGTKDAEAFGITLEPAGGSKSPTMEQLYTLGKV
ncbi:anti-sigma factor [Flavobacterium sp. SUN052]|uniref:anti-sigma factor n=1 Tax=Flavobacterium sp. SUN052 TaxID=3002441 RepID=UPI00237ECC51|nr:anti-sigma factor [Flavobacterium sp. SUN052]MEC4005587.1 anti-sigma factor [Flavobacterium sp. SUN052]